MCRKETLSCSYDPLATFESCPWLINDSFRQLVRDERGREKEEEGKEEGACCDRPLAHEVRAVPQGILHPATRYRVYDRR